MLKILGLRSLVKNQEFAGQSNIIDPVGDDNKINEPKSWANSQAKLSNSKFLVELSSESSFLTLKASVLFAKLKQKFIKVSILYYCNLKYHILIEI